MIASMDRHGAGEWAHTVLYIHVENMGSFDRTMAVIDGVPDTANTTAFT
jgi:hypothetical protein